MKDSASVPRALGYVVTDLGREVLASEGFCLCQIRLAGVLLTCVECGTVYGSLKSAALPVGASRVKPA